MEYADATPVPPAPGVPGFELLSLVRFSRTGETWAARDRESGEQVSVTLVTGALASAAEPLVRFRHPHVVPLHHVLAAGRQLALVSVAAPQVTLATLCAERPALDPGEVVTLGVPIAQALAAAHDRSIVHGDLDPGDLVIDDAGRPLLTGLGIAALSPTAAAAPPDDVLALALILQACLGDDSGPRAEAVRGALSPALSGHPAGRPEAGQLAASLSLACPAQPLRRRPAPLPMVDPAAAAASRATGGHRRARASAGERAAPGGAAAAVATALVAAVEAVRHRLRGPALTATLAVAGLLLLLVIAPRFDGHAGASPAVLSARAATSVTGRPAPPSPAGPALPSPAGSAPAPARAAATATPTLASVPPPAAAARTAGATANPAGGASVDWGATVSGIVAARDAAFSQLSAVALGRADAPGSSADGIDRQRLSALLDAGVRAQGLSTRIDLPEPPSAPAPGLLTQRLTVLESTSAYDLIDSEGTPVEHRPASPAERWALTLVRTPGGWRAADVVPAPVAAGGAQGAGSGAPG